MTAFSLKPGSESVYLQPTNKTIVSMAKASPASLSYESLAIGIDIGGTGTKFGIVDRNGNVLFSSEISTRGHAEVEGFIGELYANLVVMIEKAGGSGRMRGIGVG